MAGVPINPRAVAAALMKRRTPEWDRGSILPIETNRGSGEMRLGIPTALDSIASALAAPGNALRGEYKPQLTDGRVDPYSSLIPQAFNMANVAGMSSLPIPGSANTLGTGLRSWFGASKAATPEGNPLTLYHGTGSNFDTFDLAKSQALSGSKDVGFHFGSAEQANTRAMMAADGGNVMPVHLSVQNPVRLPDLGYWSPSNVAYELHKLGKISVKEFEEIADGKRTIQAVMKEKGIDGIVYRNAVEGSGDSYIALDPKQVKSAIGNSGAYSPDDPNILRSAGLGYIVPQKEEKKR